MVADGTSLHPRGTALELFGMPSSSDHIPRLRLDGCIDGSILKHYASGQDVASWRSLHGGASA